MATSLATRGYPSFDKSHRKPQADGNVAECPNDRLSRARGTWRDALVALARRNLRREGEKGPRAQQGGETGGSLGGIQLQGLATAGVDLE